MVKSKIWIRRGVFCIEQPFSHTFNRDKFNFRANNIIDVILKREMVKREITR